ncbi:pregnancy-specific glycoprotein 22-like isoform X3 [Ascaphus truei]|uniref:pregnancy-specific glycoprotein 22-like isoform X3 n=1 Tax=Ascaphus truei TaxID=8439 RepID=UPI003F59D395
MLCRRDTPPRDPPRLRVCVLAGLLSLWMEVTSGFVIQLIPESPAVGQSVTLKVTGVTGRILRFDWYKGSGTDAQNQILFYLLNAVPSERPGPLYLPRARGLRDGSLQISSLVTADQGHYTVCLRTDSIHEASVYLPVLLSLWMEVTSEFIIQLIPESPAVGQSVTLKVTGVTGTVKYVVWYKGSGPDSVNLILGYLPGSNIERPGPQYFSRASPLPDGSLQISDLVTSDRGNYTAQIQTDKGQLQYTVYLPVYVDSESSHPDHCAEVIAGIICGAVLGTVLIISGAVLLYKRCVLPVRECEKGPSHDNLDLFAVYDDVLTPAMGQAANEDSSYMGLQFQTQDTYSEMQI